jgi:hypothetical protein
MSAAAQQTIFGNVTFHHFAIILGGSAAAVSCLIALTLMAQHATHLSKPREQYKYISIKKSLLFIAYRSTDPKNLPRHTILFAHLFLSICFPKIFVFISAWFSYIEAVSFATLFLLLCENISSPESERELFAALEIKQKNGPALRGNGTLAWYRVCGTNFIYPRSFKG